MNYDEMQQIIKEASLNNARTFMKQAFEFYELAILNPTHLHLDGSNVFERRADDAARDAEAQFELASYYNS
jgi:hypothetical protein